jgi:hypothetical protein
MNTQTSMTNILILLIGLSLGMISGVIGLGGGIFIIPALTVGFGTTQHKT